MAVTPSITPYHRASRIVLTGAGSGIGLALAQALAADGHQLALLGRREQALHEARAQLVQHGPAHRVHAVDVADAQALQQTMQDILTDWQGVDVLINNAGVGAEDLAEHCPVAVWDHMQNTNVRAAFLSAQAVIPSMRAQGWGWIINTGSQASQHGYERAVPYCASKFALLGMGMALQEEVRSAGIRVHTLCPGLVQVPAPSQPHERRGGVLQVEDLAHTVRFLLSLPPHMQVENIGLYHL